LAAGEEAGSYRMEIRGRHREESRKKKEVVEQLMKKDGYLDAQTRRDKKIGDLGI